MCKAHETHGRKHRSKTKEKKRKSNLQLHTTRLVSYHSDRISAKTTTRAPLVLRTRRNHTSGTLGEMLAQWSLVNRFMSWKERKTCFSIEDYTMLQCIFGVPHTCNKGSPAGSIDVTATRGSTTLSLNSMNGLLGGLQIPAEATQHLQLQEYSQEHGVEINALHVARKTVLQGNVLQLGQHGTRKK